MAKSYLDYEDTDFMKKFYKGDVDVSDLSLSGEDPSLFKGLLGDKYMMSNLTGLAGTAMQALSLPTMLKNAKLQNRALKFNLATAKEEQARRNKNIAGFNAVGQGGATPSQPVSAFASPMKKPATSAFSNYT